MEDLYQQGKLPDDTTAVEMVNRLHWNNYISPSVQKLCQELLLSEYRRFYEIKTALIRKENDPMTTQENNQNTKKKGLFSLFRGKPLMKAAVVISRLCPLHQVRLRCQYVDSPPPAWSATIIAYCDS